MLKPEVKTAWLEALRSGRYKQGRGQLFNSSKLMSLENTYCCLGVLCDISNLGQFKDAGVNYIESTPDHFIPKAVRKWSGLSSDAEDILVAFNDVQDKSFAEIGDYIEEKY